VTLHSIVAAICLWCAASTPAVAHHHNSLECFASQAQAWQTYPGQHVRHHKTPNGVCYHIGRRNHSGVFTKEISTPKTSRLISTATAKENIPSGSASVSGWKTTHTPHGYLEDTQGWTKRLDHWHDRRNPNK
jgi:hypothetical protein